MYLVVFDGGSDFSSVLGSSLAGAGVTCAVCVGAGALSVAGGVEVAPAAGAGVDAAAGLG